MTIDAYQLNRSLSRLFLGSDAIQPAAAREVLKFCRRSKARCEAQLATTNGESRWTWRQSWHLADCLQHELADRLARVPETPEMGRNLCAICAE